MLLVPPAPSGWPVTPGSPGLNTQVAQFISLARGFGIDLILFVEAFTGTAADSLYLQARAAMMLRGGGRTGTTVDSMRMDLGLVADAARALGVCDLLLDAQQMAEKAVAPAVNDRRGPDVPVGSDVVPVRLCVMEGPPLPRDPKLDKFNK